MQINHRPGPAKPYFWKGLRTRAEYGASKVSPESTPAGPGVFADCARGANWLFARILSGRSAADCSHFPNAAMCKRPSLTCVLKLQHFGKYRKLAEQGAVKFLRIRGERRSTNAIRTRREALHAT
jgi:hypothetical protein